MALDEPYLNIVESSFRILLNVHIDGEMRIDISHLVFEPFRNTEDEIVDDCLDCAEGSDVLTSAMVEFNVDGGLRRTGEAD